MVKLYLLKMLNAVLRVFIWVFKDLTLLDWITGGVAVTLLAKGYTREGVMVYILGFILSVYRLQRKWDREALEEENRLSLNKGDLEKSYNSDKPK